MAIPLRTFGNTLTDLQAGTNAAQGLDYSRANAQDAINQARLEAFLRLRGQQAAVQAQQNSMAQERAMRMAELAQQNQQFGTSEANRLTAIDKMGANQLAVAKESRGGIDPRAYEANLVFNQQGADKQSVAEAMSARRQALMKEIKAASDVWQYYAPWNGSLSSQFKATYGRDPDHKAAAAALSALDAQAIQNGLKPNDTTWGYDYSPFTPVPLGNLRGGSAPYPNAGPSALPAIQQTPAVQTQVPAMLQGGDVSLGGVPLNNYFVAPPVDALAPSTVAPPPNRTIRVNPDGSLFYVQ